MGALLRSQSVCQDSIRCLHLKNYTSFVAIATAATCTTVLYIHYPEQNIMVIVVAQTSTDNCKLVTMAIETMTPNSTRRGEMRRED